MAALPSSAPLDPGEPGGPGAREGTPLSRAGGAGCPDLRCPGVPADGAAVRALRERISRWALAAGLRPDQVLDVEIAVYEAMANVVVHAYPATATGTFDVEAHACLEAVTITVTDRGQWQPVPRPVPLHGRGIPLIRKLADEACIDAGAAGTTVTMSWAMPRARR
ncbi:ATP-binding protein [Amycolatopsis sp. CA-128772]|uniref:ATP-binding protein n=1 Tax=Amycolatopsis sp. CA-128772 TaxID=2073159 RepID=UPI000CD17E4A|nr:ATP-binding protein [Amycolatopsis sp. CA-128772]